MYAVENEKQIKKIYIEKYVNQDILKGALTFVSSILESCSTSFLAQMCTASY